MHLSDMCFPQEEHTNAGLTDTARRLYTETLLRTAFYWNGQLRAFLTSRLYQLLFQSLINTDTHGRKLRCDIQNWIIYRISPFNVPVIIVQTAIVLLTEFHLVTVCSDKYRTIQLRNLVLLLLRCAIPLSSSSWSSQMLDLFRKITSNVLILICHIVLGHFQCLVNRTDNGFQCLTRYDLFLLINLLQSH